MFLGSVTRILKDILTSTRPIAVKHGIRSLYNKGYSIVFFVSLPWTNIQDHPGSPQYQPPQRSSGIILDFSHNHNQGYSELSIWFDCCRFDVFKRKFTFPYISMTFLRSFLLFKICWINISINIKISFHHWSIIWIFNIIKCLRLKVQTTQVRFN